MCAKLPVSICVFALMSSAELTVTAARGHASPDVVDELLAIPAPPPNWEMQARERNEGRPTGERDWFAGQPPDDAAPDVILGYWIDRSWDEDAPLPSAEARNRLLDACESQPEFLPHILNLLPDTPEAHDRIGHLFETLGRSQNDDPVWMDVGGWLAMHSDKYRAELIDLARRASDRDDWIENEDALRALTAKDWTAAKPIIQDYLSSHQAGVVAVCRALLYEHALASGDAAETTRTREELKRLAVDSAACGLPRATACEALMGSAWPGRDDWFLGLFSDSVLESTGALARVVKSAPDYWVPRVIPLIEGRDRAAHNAAVHCLEQFHLEDARPDALRPLLPWLSEPDWASRLYSTDRLRLIQSLDRVNLPESVPGLIWVAEHDSESALVGAADALAFYKAKEAIPALKKALTREPEEHHRQTVIRAVSTLGGFTPDEIVAAVEAYADVVASYDDESRLFRRGPLSKEPPPDPTLSVGRFFALDVDRPVDDAAQKLVARVAELQVTDVTRAQRIWNVISAWPTRATDAEILRRVASGQLDSATIVNAIKHRASFRLNVPDELKRLNALAGVPAGVAAVLIGDQQRYDNVLRGADRDAQRMLLACARLVRESLPVERVAGLLMTSDRSLGIAAESYLESEDSRHARELVLAQHPGEARILGARERFDPGHSCYSEFERLEERLRRRVLADDGPNEIHALLSAGNWGDCGQRVVQIRGDTVELLLFENKDDPQRRNLGNEQWRSVSSFLERHAASDLAPLNVAVMDGMQYEYIHLTRNGGRRVFMNSPDTVGGSIYDRIVRKFTEISAPSKLQP